MVDADRLRHFEALYSASDDPWDVRGAWYEQRKRALVLASLARPRYRSAFEPGCGNGEMSAALALRCESLVACDGAASAVDAARRRLADARNVRVEQRRLPHDWPRTETFDLVVVSELAYYFGLADVGALLAAAASCLAPGGELLMCHYLGDFDDRASATDAVHGAAHATPGLAPLLRHRDERFLLETWRKEGNPR
ncbi:methyltransferase domain-containing protein [Telluria beijingensis]|uniref:methyltransferase domain-containing protein n=1 Tax=Telluria beijingensis TaxID=3068633 RepID=UPI00279620C5|nr:methyltransferase domain-containing protein [Massilia sp. REN29]